MYNSTDYDALATETLQDLLIRLVNPEVLDEDKESVAAAIRERYPVKENASEYAYVACDAPVEDAVMSFALRVLYVYGRKFPDAPEPMEAFQTVMSRKSRSMFVRTQAFMHLLLLDVDAAEAAARTHMATMVKLAITERRYPTLRSEDASAYEEAMLKLLFH